MSACPRCHRPLDDGEVYVCCADLQLQWRCESCHKVSEGFAFPYGTCPHCGVGTLAHLDRGPIGDGDGQGAIRMAFEIEQGGQAFYDRAARTTQEPALRELFSRFAAMEEEHMAILARRYHVDLPRSGAELRLDRAAKLTGIEGRPEDPANLFRMAIAFEEQAQRLFAERGEQAAVGSAEAELCRELAAEEREHAALLATAYARWQVGKTALL